MSPEIGSIVEGTVVGITNFGAFVELPDGNTGLVHISEISDEYVKQVKDFLKRDDKVKVKVIGKNKKGKFDLSIKKAKEDEPKKERSIQRKPRHYKDNAQKPYSHQKSGYSHQKPGYGQKYSQSSIPKKGVNFEDKLAQFLKDSEERQLDIKKNTEAKRKKGRYSR